MNHLIDGGRVRFPEVSADLWELQFNSQDASLAGLSIAVVDCSFIDPGTRVAARLGGHGHLLDWIELVPELSCDALVLAHLPPETTAESILERLPEELPGTATIVPWVAGPR